MANEDQPSLFDRIMPRTPLLVGAVKGRNSN